MVDDRGHVVGLQGRHRHGQERHVGTEAQAAVDDPGADGRAGRHGGAAAVGLRLRASPLGHAEVVFDKVRVPAANMLLGEGRGFEIAQGRLGPGRIHHCMRFIGLGERAIEAMCKRAKDRSAFGSTLAEMGAVRQAIGQSRCELEQARLITLKAAWVMDQAGNKAARNEIAMAKIIVPTAVGAIIDRAIQIHGGAGLSQDFFLAEAFAETRFLRIGDGPDEVHREALARVELARH
jgi:acyl-CoA dehydrogenase